MNAWIASRLFYSVLPLFFLIPVARTKAEMRPISEQPQSRASGVFALFTTWRVRGHPGFWSAKDD
jgi:hypothetical protein